MLKPTLGRGKEFRDFNIGMMFPYINHYVRPCIMPMVVFAIHGAKTNKEGKHADCRATTYGHEFLLCPLVHLSIHMLKRLVVGDGQPLPESVADSNSW